MLSGSDAREHGLTSTQYRHTQIGWVVIGSLGLGGLVSVLILLANEFVAPLFLAAAFFLLLGMLFATLTVQVDSAKITLHFGIGLFRKTIDLAEVRHFSAVKNPWYYGWGMHYFPGGAVYNVSGFSAVELVLKKGKRIRIGTDEPEALCRAIEKVVGRPESLSREEIEQAKRDAWKAIILSIAIVTAIAGAVGGLFYLEEQPPVAVAGPETFTVESFLYGKEFALSDITGVHLERRLPRIRSRTNGYALGRTLRGHFRLDELGDGQLFIEAGIPPYLLVRRGSDYVIVNFEDPAETRQLFQQLNERREMVGR